jgi:hypothetical protein
MVGAMAVEKDNQIGLEVVDVTQDVTLIYCDATYQRDTARLFRFNCWSCFAFFTASLSI